MEYFDHHGHGLKEGIDRISYIVFIISSVVGKVSSGYLYCHIGFDSLYTISFGIE